MEDKEYLVCNYNLFDLHQKIIYIHKNDIKTITISTYDKLGKDLAELCFGNKNISIIKLFGNSEAAKKIINDFDLYSNQMYSNKNIIIEVNNND